MFTKGSNILALDSNFSVLLVSNQFYEYNFALKLIFIEGFRELFFQYNINVKLIINLSEKILKLD